MTRKPFGACDPFALQVTNSLDCVFGDDAVAANEISDCPITVIGTPRDRAMTTESRVIPTRSTSPAASEL